MTQTTGMTTTVRPTIYVKSGCPWCEEALEFLDAHKLAYDKIVVSGDKEAFDEMVKLSGQTKAPTMDWDGEVLADFGAAELEVFLKKHKVI
jgi:glutaredoxin 3